MEGGPRPHGWDAREINRFQESYLGKVYLPPEFGKEDRCLGASSELRKREEGPFLIEIRPPMGNPGRPGMKRTWSVHVGG